MEFNEKLQELRKARSLTQEELAVFQEPQYRSGSPEEGIQALIR